MYSGVGLVQDSISLGKEGSMMFFIGEGGLGNQLFQYAFIRTIQKNHEMVVTYGFDAINTYFSTKKMLTISSKHRLLRVLVRYVLHPILKLASKYRVITTITQMSDRAGYERTGGLFRNIRYIQPGFFQSQHFFSPGKIRHLHLKNVYDSAADTYVRALPSQKNLVYIHFRFGDYLHYRVAGQNVILPESYYIAAIHLVTHQYKNSHFLLLSDDVGSIPQKIIARKNVTVVRGVDEGTTMGIMSRCRGAILSPSSFGWWGAYFMKDHKAIYSPLNWLGFNAGKEYPPSCTPTYAHTIKVI